jgi:hypothetical protein
MSAVRRLVRKLVPVYWRSRVHFALVRTPGVAEVFARTDRTGFSRITKDTRLVIEGCPRSGNSYALAAFRHVNEGVKVSSHRHSPTAVRTGLKRGIPVMVIIRHPRATITSGLQYYPDQPPAWAIQVYRSFYEGILPVADRVMIATFEEVTGDMGEVIRRANARFGTSFVPYERSDESEADLRAVIDQWALENFEEAELPRISGMPSGGRKSADELLGALDPQLVAEIDELDKLYNAVLLHR